MNQSEIIAFFDRLAKTWDEHLVKDDEKIQRILDTAGVKPGHVVLDVGCGTGVLFPDYLKRDVSRVIGVDISPEMVRIAGAKLHDPRVEVLCGDITTLQVHLRCHEAVLYNCFPHFPDPALLLDRLRLWLLPGGRITVAHSMGLEALARHHAGAARHVSREMLPAEELAELMEPWYQVDTAISQPDYYLVSGRLR